MRTRRLATWTGLGLWLGFLVAETTARAEDKPPTLVGYVKKLVPDRDGGDREVGVEKAQITIKGTGNWVGSDAHGQFRVQLLRSVRFGQSIEVEVEGVPGWLMYQPADGRVVVPEAPQTVTLKLLPKGSLRFLGSQGLASLLARMMSEAKESARSSPVVPLGTAPPSVDLKGPMQKWASEYGLSLEQVQTAVDKWAKDVIPRLLCVAQQVPNGETHSRKSRIRGNLLVRIWRGPRGRKPPEATQQCRKLIATSRITYCMGTGRMMDRYDNSQQFSHGRIDLRETTSGRHRGAYISSPTDQTQT